MISTIFLLANLASLPDLHREMRTASPPRLVEICRVLGDSGDGRSVGYLAATARKHSGAVRTSAIQGLIQYFDDPEPFAGPYVRSYAIQALQSMAEWAREDLVKIVLEERGWRRVQAALAVLERTPDRRLIPRLIEITQAPYKELAPSGSELYVTYQARISAIKMLREMRAIEAAPMMLQWMATREKYHAIKYFEEVRYEPAREALANATLPARVRQGDDAAYRRAVELVQDSKTERNQREEALKAVAARGDAEARSVLLWDGGLDAAAWLVRLRDMRGWEIIVRSSDGTVANYYDLPKTPADVAAVEAAMPQKNKKTGLIFSFESRAGLDAIDRMAASDRAFKDGIRGRVDRLRFRVAPSAYRTAVMGTFTRLRTEVDGSFGASRAAWEPLAQYLRGLMAKRFDASAMPASDLSQDWRIAERGITAPLYVEAVNLPGAVYLRLYTAQFETLDPEKGERRRDLQGAFIYWKDGASVRFQDVTELLGGRHIAEGKAGRVARIGDRLVLVGRLSENKKLFAVELRLKGGSWHLLRQQVAGFGQSWPDQKVAVFNGQFRLWRQAEPNGTWVTTRF